MKTENKRIHSKWQWYSVKLIFESILSGGPEPDTADESYPDRYKMYEESLVLVKAQSFGHAYKIAEKKAKEAEAEYQNPYGESVHHKFVEAIDCFLILEETLLTGVELAWRVLRVPKETDPQEFIDTYYPDTIPVKDGIDPNFILRSRDFNTRPDT
jgi:hypothetical protein